MNPVFLVISKTNDFAFFKTKITDTIRYIVIRTDYLNILIFPLLETDASIPLPHPNTNFHLGYTTESVSSLKTLVNIVPQVYTYVAASAHRTLISGKRGGRKAFPRPPAFLYSLRTSFGAAVCAYPSLWAQPKAGQEWETVVRTRGAHTASRRAQPRQLSWQRTAVRQATLAQTLVAVSATSLSTPSIYTYIANVQTWPISARTSSARRSPVSSKLLCIYVTTRRLSCVTRLDITRRIIFEATLDVLAGRKVRVYSWRGRRSEASRTRASAIFPFFRPQRPLRCRGRKILDAFPQHFFLCHFYEIDVTAEIQASKIAAYNGVSKQSRRGRERAAQQERAYRPRRRFLRLRAARTSVSLSPLRRLFLARVLYMRRARAPANKYNLSSLALLL